MGQTFDNSGSGEQNIAQGNEAIGKLKQDTKGDGNIVVGSGKVHIEEHHHHPLPQTPIPRHLPHLDVCFFGRDKELAELTDQLYPGKVIAICGPGGIGKSALAAQAVNKLEPTCFPDGIFFHDFYIHPETNIVLENIAQEFGIEPVPTLDIAVRNALASKKALLILDGTEDAENLPAILNLRGCCGILITSRKISDATDSPSLIELKVLAEQEAVNVLRFWCGISDDEEVFRGISELLDGLPIALRIAGHYLRRTRESAAEYMQWLEKETLRQLDQGKHKFESVPVLLRRSVEQVSTANQDAALVLALAGTLAFAPITRELVAGILNDDVSRSRDVLHELMNFGFFERKGNRWQLSHVLIHVYTRSELALDDASNLRLWRYYITFASMSQCTHELRQAMFESFRDGDDANFAQIMEEWLRQQENCCARLNQERVHLLRLIEIHQNIYGMFQSFRMMTPFYDYLNRQGYWTDALKILNLELVAAKESDDLAGEAVCLNDLGSLYIKKGECMNKAIDCLQQSLSISKKLGDKKSEAVLLHNIAQAHFMEAEKKASCECRSEMEDKVNKHLKYLFDSAALHHVLGEEDGLVLCSIGMAYAIFNKDRFNALNFLQKGLDVHRKKREKLEEAVALHKIGKVIITTPENITEGLKYFEQSLAILHELVDKNEESIVCWDAGGACCCQGDFRKAEEYMSRAVRLAEEIGSPYLEQFRNGLERVRKNDGQPWRLG